MNTDNQINFSDKIPGWGTTANILREVSKNYSVPEDMVLSAMTPVISTVVSMLNDVEIDRNWEITPASFSCCVAGSGTGKSMLTKLFRKPLDEFEEAIQARKNDDFLITLTIDDFTKAALLNLLGTRRCSIGVISPEGKVTMNSEFFRSAGHMCQLHSGEPMKVSRLYGESLTIRHSRLSIGIMIQKDTLDSLSKNHMSTFRDTGLAARFLFSIPGVSPENKNFSNEQKSWDNTEVFYARIRELLTESLALYKDPSIPREVIKVSTDGREYLVGAQNAIGKKMQPDGLFFECEDFGAKFPELLVRVAALFHRFEGLNGDISVRSLENAFVICSYHAQCFRKLFYKPPEEELDARMLDENFTNEYRSKGVYFVPLSDFRWTGIPSSLRRNSRYRRALQTLVQQGRISITGTGHKGDPECVNLSPLITCLGYSRDFIVSY